MSYTIGTALTDARKHRLHAELLVEGHWLFGLVTAVDGFGVVLEREDGSHSVIRIESIAAVEVTPGGGTGDHRPGSHPRHAARQMATAS